MSRTSLTNCAVSDEHEYVTPKRAVMKMEDMTMWEKSEAYQEYLGFFISLNESVKGKSIHGKYPESPCVQSMVDLLETMEHWIDEYPPVEQPQRFGNQAFKSWYKRLSQDAIELLQKALPVRLYRAIPEIMVYLVEGFGNPTRIDYGTGHEMSFLWLLCCLYKIGAFTRDDNAAVVLKVFNRYMHLVRKLQTTYRMEPAGSHGVWSLDDYQFMPFIWGSSQLVAHPRIEPKSFLQQDIVDAYKHDYLFIACIDFINRVKTGPFPEHSNQLWNVSGVPNWSRVNMGLIKMYKVEVLNKFPVIQHVLFGSLMPFKMVSTSNIIRGTRLSVTPQDPMRQDLNTPINEKPPTSHQVDESTNK
ncbi:UNVERIFIED_CONTAM: hypothetical protein PYX00_006118 [Menopon gallinae]|uniref:Serine/threonine-protein phosphatase 2A activator n=1 Tax=Menopon gallinae TaxID=328185 RepID=A0AAW2HU37_9NEOP